MGWRKRAGVHLMSRGINKCILVGNVGQDPEVRYLPNGGAVANVTLATSESWMDKNSGQKQEKTEWHRIVFFGKLADIVSQYVKKGSKLYVEGKLQTRKWQDQSGNDKYTTEIVVDGFSGQMQMLDGRQDVGGQQQVHSPAQNVQQPTQQHRQSEQNQYAAMQGGQQQVQQQPQQPMSNNNPYQQQQPAMQAAQNMPGNGNQDDQIPF